MKQGIGYRPQARRPNDALGGDLSPRRRRWLPFAPRWNVWAAGFGGSQTTDGNAALGSNTATSSIYGAAVGADYSLLAGYRRRLCAGRRRHQFQRRQWRLRPLRPVPGRRLRAPQRWRGLYHARRWPTAGRTSPPTAPSPSPAPISCARSSTPMRSRAASRAAIALSTPWMGGIGLTPYAAAQVTTFDLPAYAESVVSGADTFALTYGAKSVTATRSELGLRTDKSFAIGRCDPDAARPRRLGARLQSRPLHRRDLPDAAGRIVRRQRCGAGARLRALTTASAEMKWHQRLVARRHLRGRVLRRHPQLRRQGRRPLSVVTRDFRGWQHDLKRCNRLLRISLTDRRARAGRRGLSRACQWCSARRDAARAPRRLFLSPTDSSESLASFRRPCAGITFK